MAPSPRNRPLDILRGLAVLLVLGRHLPQEIEAYGGAAASVLRLWRQIGWTGVDLFFVLSGFLVSGLLFGEFRSSGKIRLGRFLVRRGLRIYPAFYFLIAVTLAVVWRETQLKRVLVEVFFLQSYFVKDCLWLHTWTLAIEEHFYLGLAFFALLLSKNRTADPFRLVPWLWAVSAAACLGVRIFIPFDDLRVFTLTHARIDGLLFGVFLSYLYHFHRAGLAAWTGRLRWALALSAAGLISPVFFLHFREEPFLTRFGLTFTYLAFGQALLLLLFIVRLPDKPDFLERAIRFVGVRSYSIYLWHFPAAYWVARPLGMAVGGPEQAVGWAILFYPPAALAAGWASYEWLEKPVMAWRDRRFPAPSKAVA